MTVELTTMTMVYNENTEEVLVIDRLKKYKGISFPGGHVEKGESFAEAAAREILEETGLIISELEFCGFINWAKQDANERYIELLYKTKSYEGALCDGTDEGSVFWIKRQDIYSKTLSPNFIDYLPMFFEGKHTEAFGEWSGDNFTILKYL